MTDWSTSDAAPNRDDSSLPAEFWAKTVSDANGMNVPGISVFDHCLNVGCVAELLLFALPPSVRMLLPEGIVVLSALHDIGKITLGFQAKCPAWLHHSMISERERRVAAFSVSDHALVSQCHLQDILKANKSQLWAVAVGSHHGKPKGRNAKLSRGEEMPGWAAYHRSQVTAHLIDALGPLPSTPPHSKFGNCHTDLWLLAGLITVADWIGSNETFFSPLHGQSLKTTRDLAAKALANIGWPGGRLISRPFAQSFGFPAGTLPNVVQTSLLAALDRPGLVIVEAPMGFGKTEAALGLAQRLIAAGHHQGIYFALPTQVTSNRIHQRVAQFLANSLEETARLRLAHGNSWLESDSDIVLSPAYLERADDDDNPRATVSDARSWFASAKQALLAPYGVGTIDQALQGMVAVKHFFVRRFALAGKVVILDEIHSYDVYTGTLVTALVGELIRLGCTVIVLSATLTAARRRELLAAAESEESTAANAYPLITVGHPRANAVHHSPGQLANRRVQLRTAVISDDDTLVELIKRAEAGQHVLWIRNTVVEAQSAFRLLRAELFADTSVRVGLLHSRFPFVRRQELETDWLEHLGRNRASDGPGSILIATQVVEQSVDIDLDFIVSDLAPTDMLLQRLGRLWRHARERRAANQPEFWIRLPEPPADDSIRTLKKSLGRSAKVYAPWVLLRSSRVFADRSSVEIPCEIRDLLEATYAPPNADEPPAWAELHADLVAERDSLAENAAAVMQVLGRPAVSDDEFSKQALTRRRGPPTVNLLILREVETLPQRRCRLTAPDGSSVVASEFDWQMENARFVHRWTVRSPTWLIPADSPRPRWLTQYLHGECSVATLDPDTGLLRFGDAVGAAGYHPDIGLFGQPPYPPSHPSSTWKSKDDDEFDY